eukprot:10293666-Heterocapsa_arctica.AAC.1
MDPEEHLIPEPRDVGRVARLAVVVSVLGKAVGAQDVPELLARPSRDPTLPRPVPHVRGLLVVLGTLRLADLPVLSRGRAD